jgi:hypothetical protein
MKAIFDGIKGGILTATQLQGSRLSRQLAQCQEAVAHALAYTALYNSPNQVTLGEPLDQTTMQKFAYVSAMMTTPFFALFGWPWFYLSELMGLFTITNWSFSNCKEEPDPIPMRGRGQTKKGLTRPMTLLTPRPARTGSEDTRPAARRNGAQA